MHRRTVFLFVCVAIVAVLLAGCGGVHKQAFNKDAHQEIRIIGFLEPVSPEKYFVQNVGHIGMSFGLIGGLIATADMGSKTSQFTELMKTRNFKVLDEFETALVSELQNAGYSVKVIKPQREKEGFLESYDGLDKDVDAYLDMGIGAGYMCASSTADYIPSVRSGVRLVKRESNEILYQDLIAYGYELRAGQAVCLAADQRYSFKNFQELSDDPDRALEGLRTGVPLVAKRIAQDLAR